MLGSQTAKPSDRDLQPEALTDELRTDLPGTGSAIVLIGETADVDEMLAGLEDRHGDAIRQTLTSDQVSALEISLKDAPPASPGPALEGEQAAEQAP
jgi:hypothetical protein